VTNKRHSGKPQAGNRFVRPLLIAGTIVAVVGGAWLYSVLSEVGMMGVLPGSRNGLHESQVHLQDQPVYRIKKKQELLGVNVIRIISKQQPEEFLVLDGVSRKLVDRIYGQKPDLVWANLMANQLVKLRQTGEGDASPVSVEVQGVKTLESSTMMHHKKQVPYWQLEVKFKLSNESEPRFYEAGVVRNIGEQPDASSPNQFDTLVVGYAQKEAFQKELVADLMDHLSFERN
jgi:hypothetical protein